MYYEDLLAQKPDMPERRLTSLRLLKLEERNKARILVASLLVAM